MAIGIGLVGGCGETVSHPISPLSARSQVVDAARDIVKALRAEVTEATFSYESCNDQGEAPFRGVVGLSFWMPGIPHNQAVDPQIVVKGLVADGWSTNSDFVSHGQTLKKNGVNVILSIAPPASPARTFARHVGADINGECGDTSDHRTDGSTSPVDISKEIQPS